MKVRLFTTEAERQRADTRAVKSFARWVAVGFFAFVSIVTIHYIWGWW